VDVGEALGLLHALEWLSDKEFDCVELDSKITTYSLAILSYFASHFTKSRVKVNRRQANMFAQVLARLPHYQPLPQLILKYPVY